MTSNSFYSFNLILVTFLAFATATAQVAANEYDPENGEAINEVCAGCHGEFGQGGSDGEYPRLAGMPAAFIARQLHLFRDRKRPNMAMIEYVDERQMPDADIQDIATFLSRITLKTKLSPANESDPAFDAYARLLESKQVMQIPRAEGDQERGGKLFRKECDSCHGKLGEGDHTKAVPMLTGQYTDYLWRQVEKYRNTIRIHDPDAPEDQLLSEFSDTELQDIFAYLSVLDD
ncbi:MAG: c-type cytochrome [Chromatiaceae bacterium]|nr:c-type cytochrome [Gammaproteobacteria bacterium]MCP5427563.1 c-type cytochrome [Chromatiaceae bacterium]MCP5447600.1 c-type cytochrome [Chromatiaceae bacterium]